MYLSKPAMPRACAWCIHVTEQTEISFSRSVELETGWEAEMDSLLWQEEKF